MAGRQHGVVARRQLLALGMGRQAIGGRVRRQLLHPLHRGVYAAGHRLITTDGRRMAAVLACGERAVLSHRSAGRLWRVLPPAEELIEVTCRSGRSAERPGIVAHRSPLAPDETTTAAEIPVTSVFRTIFDLAAVAPKREVERAFHEAEVRRLTDRVSLPMLLERHPGRPGAGVLREILADKRPAGITRNDFEERFVAFLDAHHLPRGLLNGTLPLRGRFLEPDCMWPERRLIVELDSREVHGTDRGFEGDRERDRLLLAEGWRTGRVTWRQLRDEPEAIAADLRRLLAAR